MPSCTAGDIRFYYKVLDPMTVSVIGQVAQEKPTVHIKAAQTSRKEVGMIHEGISDFHEMFRVEERGSWWETMLPRVLLVPWSAAMMNLCFAFLGRRIVGIDVLAGISCIWLGFMGTIWWKLWGKSIDCVMYLSTAYILLLWTTGRSHIRQGSWGLWPVWCMLGRWARVPPSWRMETSYSSKRDVHYKKYT
jgi:hypothetical protein